MSVVWFILGVLLQPALHWSYSAGGAQTFWPHAARNPYCIVDPTCISPLPEIGKEPTLVHGFATNDFGDMNNFRGLALPNYMLFVALLSACAFGVASFVTGRVLRRLLLAGLVLWAWFEVNRWFSHIETPLIHNGEVLWIVEHLATSFFTISAVVLAAVWARRLNKPSGETNYGGRS